MLRHQHSRLADYQNDTHLVLGELVKIILQSKYNCLETL